MTSPPTPVRMPDMRAYWPAAEYSPATAALVKNYGLACYEAGRTAAAGAPDDPTQSMYAAAEAALQAVPLTLNSVQMRAIYCAMIRSRGEP